MKIITYFILFCALLLTSCSLKTDAKSNKGSRLFNSAHATFRNDTGFKTLASPKENEWLSRFPEKGQSFNEYLRRKPNRPDDKRSVIYLQPLGNFNEKQKLLLAQTKEFTSMFFQMNVLIDEDKQLPLNCYRKRQGPNGIWEQYRGKVIMSQILKSALHKNAFCLLGVTMADIYLNDDWNFVFGLSSRSERIDIYSLARYFHSFHGEHATPGNNTEALRRSRKVMTHEICHMFELQHCIYYKYVENGSNSLQEIDEHPLHLCPICLEKLAWDIELDETQRKKELIEFSRNNKLNSEFI